MRTIVGRVTIFVLAFLMGMPAGWCCVPTVSETSSELVGQASCCRHDSSQPTSDDQPVLPDSDCCCIHDATVPQDSTVLVDSVTDVAFVSVSLDTPGRGDDHPVNAIGPVLQSGPRSHVLQCVWLC
ncbi:hypothetical protein [Thalassoroseus pseudoceratinae]|uniref:hypothetical protein n=1 Tax=Thalassoroseus pseudoceratinae TaxID=2713176 RepID=UPI00141DF6F3|nr:hypothetical protein [Thalassoroseus pseudoceratinae]